jgi:hypothetical protein
MARIIKFRCWNIDNKRFEKYLTVSMDIDINKYKPWFVFQQFTGLKDAHGTEIYEGDIVKHIYHGISAVFFQNGGYKFKGKLSVVGFGANAKHSEIIGNIYETPELLK